MTTQFAQTRVTQSGQNNNEEQMHKTGIESIDKFFHYGEDN